MLIFPQLWRHLVVAPVTVLMTVTAITAVTLLTAATAALHTGKVAATSPGYYGEDQPGDAKQFIAAAPSYPVQFQYTVLDTQPHSRRSFTQGLIVDGDELIESSGLYGKSFLHRYPVSGAGREQYHPLPKRLFAEGIALANGKLYLLTWQNGRALVLDPHTFKTESTFAYQGEGWGLATYVQATDNEAHTQLVMSNGTAQLAFRDPHSFSVLRTVTVTDREQPLHNLNDLAVAHGLIWANVWHSTAIVAIDPDSGEVVGKIDLRAQRDEQPGYGPENVLNGIAWDEQRQAFWVTGKRWAKRYLIRVEPLIGATARQ